MKRKIIKILLTILIIAVVYSFLPVVGLYMMKSRNFYNNTDVVKKLEANKGDYFEFIVLGDNHSGLIFNDSATLKEIRSINREDRFKKAPIDFAIISGDITNRGSSWDYFIFNKTRSLFKMPVVCSIGNHDDDRNGRMRYDRYAGKAEFSFADRNSYFIFVDNIIGDMDDAQFVRLEDELKKSMSYNHRFVIAHKPPMSPYFQSWYRPELSPWAYRFMKLCEKYKVDMVFSGHEHMFMEKKAGGVRYITSGGGGMLTTFPDSDGGYLHYTVVRVFGDYVDYEVRKVFPPVWEYLTYYMWKDALYFLRNIFF